MAEDLEKDLTVQILGDTEISELDWETLDALPGWKEEGKDVYCKRRIYLNKDGGLFKGYGIAEGEWVSITRIRELLDEFESKGATHVAMEHHCDHIGYMFDYGCLRVSSQEEIDLADGKEKQEQEKSKEKEIKELEDRLRELKS